MNKGSGNIMKMVGIALIILGAGLAIWGYQLSGSVESQITEVITGADTDKVMSYYIGGAVSFFSGIYLFIKN